MQPSWNVQTAEQHLRQSCAVMARLIERHGSCTLPEREFRPFETLASQIISQQLSLKAAATIKQRVRGIVAGFTPTGFLAVTEDELRQAGLSSAKARYIHELARRVDDGRLDLDSLRHAPDEEVIARLTELPGIGRWTAEMFLIFGLLRPDVLSLGDAGLQRAARQLFGVDVRLEQVGHAWRPYRTVASWYLWRSLD